MLPKPLGIIKRPYNCNSVCYWDNVNVLGVFSSEENALDRFGSISDYK